MARQIMASVVRWRCRRHWRMTKNATTIEITKKPPSKMRAHHHQADPGSRKRVIASGPLSSQLPIDQAPMPTSTTPIQAQTNTTLLARAPGAARSSVMSRLGIETVAIAVASLTSVDPGEDVERLCHQRISRFGG